MIGIEDVCKKMGLEGERVDIEKLVSKFKGDSEEDSEELENKEDGKKEDGDKDSGAGRLGFGGSAVFATVLGLVVSGLWA